MKIIYDKKIIDTNNLKYLGSGRYTDVYQYNNEALKLYKQGDESILQRQDIIKKMMNIKTSNIILPNSLVYEISNDNICGYTTNLVKDPISYAYIWNTLKDNLEQQRKILAEDLNVLNYNNIVLSDLSAYGNFIYNKNINFIDSSDYYYSSSSYLSEYNNKEVNEALFVHLFLLGENKDNIEEELNKILGSDIYIDQNLYCLIMQIYSQAFDEYETYGNFFDFISDILINYESIDEYKKQLLCTYIDNEYYEENDAINTLKRML